MISKSSIEEAIQLAIEARGTSRSSSNNQTEESFIRKQTEWSLFGNFILTRLKLKTNVKNLSGNLPSTNEDTKMSFSQANFEKIVKIMLLTLYLTY